MPRNLRVTTTSAESEGPVGYRRRLCVCIGIDRYRHWPPLANAVSDARAVASTFREDLGFETTLITNPEATWKGISEAIVDRLPKLAHEDDLAVVFFAGHGQTVTTPAGQERGYIVPVEARRDSVADLISMSELSEWTSHLPCRHVLYVFDSCFSGLATLRADPGRHRRDMLSRKARIAITAGGADQTVVDGGWEDHSVFTGHFLLGLNGEAANPEGEISAIGLFEYLARAVPANAPQTPALGVLPGHGGGDVLLALSNRGAAAIPAGEGRRLSSPERATREKTAASAASSRGETILPGIGTESIRIGQSPADVIARLGQPSERKTHPPTRTVQGHDMRMSYLELGLHLRFWNGKLKSLDFMGRKRGWQCYSGRTPEGISTNSSEEDILAAYGLPKGGYRGGNRQYMEFAGIKFTLAPLSRDIVQITVE